jgi:flagellin
VGRDPIKLGGCTFFGSGCCDGGTKRIDTQEGAINTLGLLQTAIASVSRWRGTLGAQQNRLVNAVGIIQTQNLNIRAAESAITDANMAEEVVNMTKWQILMQSGMSSLAQANASAQMVLNLFR